MSRYLLQSFQLPASLMLPCQATLLPSQSQALSSKRPMSFPQLWANLQGMKWLQKSTNSQGFTIFDWQDASDESPTSKTPTFLYYFSSLHCIVSNQISVSLIHILGFQRPFLRINSAATCQLFWRNFGFGLGPVPSSVSSNAIFLAMLGARLGLGTSSFFSAVRIRFYRHLLRSIESMIFFKEFYLNVLTDVLECT